MQFVLLVGKNFWYYQTQKTKLCTNVRNPTAQTTQCRLLLSLLPNIRNSCLNLPLWCVVVSIVWRRGGNWPLRACGDSCHLHSFSCERQQSYRFSKGPLGVLCAAAQTPFEVRNGTDLNDTLLLRWNSLSYCRRCGVNSGN